MAGHDTYSIAVQETAVMATETTYTAARANLARLCDDVTSSRQPVIIRRRGAADVALVAADELRGLVETAHLLSSPRNAQRLLKALKRARTRRLRAGTAHKLRQEMSL
jgi:antitoxin YefM